MMDENNILKITESQAKEIYDKLSPIDEESKRRLIEAQEMTDASEYENIEEIPDVVLDEYIDKWTDECEQFGIKKEYADKLTPLLKEFNNNKELDNLVDRFPEELRYAIDNKDDPEKYAKFILDSILNTVYINQLMDQSDMIYDNIDKAVDQIHTVFQNEFDNLFNNIDDIRKENPEKADRILIIKNGFDRAQSFEDVIKYTENINVNKIDKWLKHYKDDCLYFNKKVNTFENIAIPSIESLPSYLRLWFKDCDEIVFKRFVEVIIRSTVYSNGLIDMHDIGNVAYVYKLINNIINCTTYGSITDSSEAKELFDKVSLVINKLK